MLATIQQSAAPSVGSFVAGANDAASLSILNDQQINDGALAFVKTFRAYFALNKGETLAVDGTTSLATMSGVGRWRRINIVDPSWALQAAWYVDPTNGNDEGSGAVGAPLKTHGELERRWGRFAKIDQVTTVQLLGNLPLSDPMRPSMFATKNGCVRYRGTRTQVGAASTITSVTALAPASNQAWEIVDTAGVLGANVGKRIRITSGARVGSTAWIAKDLGSFRVRISQFVQNSDAVPIAITPVLITPVAGDPYVIETLSTVAATAIEALTDVDLSVNTNGIQFCFSDIDFRTTSAIGTTVHTTQSPNPLGFNFLGCDLGAMTSGGGATCAIGCRHHGGNGYGVQIFIIFSGYISSRLTINQGCAYDIDYHTISQGSSSAFRARKGGIVRVGTFGVFDATGDGMTFEADSLGRFDGDFSSVIAVYGSGNAGVGIKIEAGAKVCYLTTAPTITGTAGNVRLGGALTGRVFDDSVGTYTATRTFSWANLVAAVSAGGFGNSMINPLNGAMFALKQ